MRPFRARFFQSIDELARQLGQEGAVRPGEGRRRASARPVERRAAVSVAIPKCGSDRTRRPASGSDRGRKRCGHRNRRLYRPPSPMSDDSSTNGMSGSGDSDHSVHNPEAAAPFSKSPVSPSSNSATASASVLQVCLPCEPVCGVHVPSSDGSAEWTALPASAMLNRRAEPASSSVSATAAATATLVAPFSGNTVGARFAADAGTATASMDFSTPSRWQRESALGDLSLLTSDDFRIPPFAVETRSPVALLAALTRLLRRMPKRGRAVKIVLPGLLSVRHLLQQNRTALSLSSEVWMAIPPLLQQALLAEMHSAESQAAAPAPA